MSVLCMFLILDFLGAKATLGPLQFVKVKVKVKVKRKSFKIEYVAGLPENWYVGMQVCN